MIESENEAVIPSFHVGPSPHIYSSGHSTRRMMMDVLLALLPVMGMALFVFHWHALVQPAICLASCLAFEAAFVKLRKKPISLNDFSAAITGIILGLSLPATAPWYTGVIGAAVAMGIGKVLFGGLGMNLFNPAMVGRAFVMIAFAGAMAASGYEMSNASVDIMSRATPLTAYKQSGISTPLVDLFFGMTNGSPGEVSAVACIIGGLFLCLRRTASWEIPVGLLVMVVIWGGISDMLSPDSHWTLLHHLTGGAMLFGAFFIATDPVTSPLTPMGKFIFGLGTGFLIMLLRTFSGYPEGVMFAVLLMNAVTPLINRWVPHRTLGEKP